MSYREEIQKQLATFAQSNDFYKASKKLASGMVPTIKGSFPDNHWDWDFIEEQIQKYVYLAITVTDYNEPGAWADIEWVLQTSRSIKEQLLPRLKKYGGKVFFKLDAGFLGLKAPNKRLKKHKIPEVKDAEVK